MAPLWHDGFTDKFERERESLLKVYKVSAFGFNERVKGAKRMERDGGGGEVLHITIWPSKNNGRQICRCRFLRQSNESHKRWWASNKRHAYGKRRMYRFRHSKVEKITKRWNNYSWLFRWGGGGHHTAEEQDGIGSREIQQVRCFFFVRPSQDTIVDDRNLLLAPVCAHWNWDFWMRPSRMDEIKRNDLL